MALENFLLDNLASLGIIEDLKIKTRYGYYAVINLGEG